MAVFFIETSTGQVATQRQLVEAGVVPAHEKPRLPWLRIQGTDDATTLWYAVLRKEVRARRSGGAGSARERIFIGALAFRHTDHHASLLQQGWQEVEPAAISARAA